MFSKRIHEADGHRLLTADRQTACLVISKVETGTDRTISSRCNGRTIIT